MLKNVLPCVAVALMLSATSATNAAAMRTSQPELTAGSEIVAGPETVGVEQAAATASFTDAELLQRPLSTPSADSMQLAACGYYGYGGYGYYAPYYRSYRSSYYGGYYGRPSYYGGYYGRPSYYYGGNWGYGGYPGYGGFYGRPGVSFYLGF